MNNNKPPQKSPKNWKKKTSIFNTFETMPDTPKTNRLILKPQKKQTQEKHHFAMFKNNPLVFINFCFSTYSFCFQKLCFAENTIKIVFSGKHSFSKTQLLKPTSSTMSKNTLFQKKVSFLFFFGNFRWNPYCCSASCFALFWSKHKILAKTDSVHENAHFSPFLTQLVSGNFC